jgi:hypothetical protein
MNDGLEPPDLLLQLGNVFVPVGKDGFQSLGIIWQDCVAHGGFLHIIY